MTVWFWIWLIGFALTASGGLFITIRENGDGNLGWDVIVALAVFCIWPVTVPMIVAAGIAMGLKGK